VAEVAAAAEHHEAPAWAAVAGCNLLSMVSVRRACRFASARLIIAPSEGVAAAPVVGQVVSQAPVQAVWAAVAGHNPSLPDRSWLYFHLQVSEHEVGPQQNAEKE